MRRHVPVLLAGLLAFASCASFEGPPSPKVVIFFGHASTALDDAARSLVEIAASRAKAHPEALVTVAGYAANNGDPDADAALAARRAQVVAALLERDGVDESRVQVIPRPPSNEDARVGSRRVEISIGSSS